jgi:uncharacterized protein
MSKKKIVTGAVAAGALAVPAAAQAHVTLQPKTAVAGAYTVETVRVPNEKDNAATTKVDIRLPDGFAAASYQATPGWAVKVAKTKLAKPIKTDDGDVTEQVSRITWTARSKADAIQPGQFRDFPLSVQIPGKAGDTLTFKALQTYSDGEVVRWIGAPDSDTPAPQISVMAADEAAGGHGAATKATSAPAQPAAAVTRADGGGASKGLAITALIVGALGLAAGVAALATRRRA